jgi:cytochrome c oxidase assembly factor CtaG
VSWLLAFLVFVYSPAALAHGVPSSGLNALADEETWTFDLKVTLPLAISMLIYATGVVRLWNHAGVNKGVRKWQVRCFAFGWAFLALALVAPLHWLGEQLFVAHMVEHEVLMTVSAPLIVIARPYGAMMWGLPFTWRSRLGHALQNTAFLEIWSFLVDPPVATALHAVAIWAWHIPGLFDAALQNSWVHWAQHLSFFLTALLFWRALLGASLRVEAEGMAVVYLFITALHCSLLGVLITLARRPLYPSQASSAIWGLTPLQDQQAAGLVMWIPPGIVYAAAALFAVARWIERSASKPQ